jgi:hypothetical protein
LDEPAHVPVERLPSLPTEQPNRSQEGKESRKTNTRRRKGPVRTIQNEHLPDSSFLSDRFPKPKADPIHRLPIFWSTLYW